MYERAITARTHAPSPIINYVELNRLVFREGMRANTSTLVRVSSSSIVAERIGKADRRGFSLTAIPGSVRGARGRKRRARAERNRASNLSYLRRQNALVGTRNLYARAIRIPSRMRGRNGASRRNVPSDAPARRRLGIIDARGGRARSAGPINRAFLPSYHTTMNLRLYRTGDRRGKRRRDEGIRCVISR